MANQLEHSDILFAFLAIMRSAPILPLPMSPVQPLLIRAAVDLTPHWLRRIVGLTDHGLNALEAGVSCHAADVSLPSCDQGGACTNPVA